MKKIYSFIIFTILLISAMPLNAMEDLITSPPAARKRLFKVAPKNHKEAEELILPILKPTKKIKKASKAFFNLAFKPENAKSTAFLTTPVWNNLIDHLFGKGEEDQLLVLNSYYMRGTRLIDRRRRD